MKHYVTVLLISLCLISGAVSAAEVSNITLAHENGFTVARIDVDGTVRFSHQTEIAKDGRPFRVIVDILAAVHELGATNFTELPQSTITGIRSSQFAVNPEQVVRVVFDMDHETVYQVEAEDNCVNISFPDKIAVPFANWSTREVVNALNEAQRNKAAVTSAAAPASPPTVAGSDSRVSKTASELNVAINKDRQSSLQASVEKGLSGDKQEAEPPQKTKPTTIAKTTTPPEGNKAQESIQKPQKDDFRPEVAAQPDVRSQDQPIAGKPSIKKSESKAEKATAEKTILSKTVAAVPPPGEPAKDESFVGPPLAAMPPYVEPEPDPEPVRNETGDQKSQEPPQSQKDPTPPTDKAQEPAPEPDIEEPEDTDIPDESFESPPTDKKPTSRFRRSPTSPTKIKGTLVAEFPKRLVIKYKASGADPFETLINEAKTNNSLVEKKIPNVEALRMVGVLETADGENSALFEDTDGYGYILKEGDKVKKGYVLRIEADRVYFQIFEYGWSRTLALDMEEF